MWPPRIGCKTYRRRRYHDIRLSDDADTLSFSYMPNMCVLLIHSMLMPITVILILHLLHLRLLEGSPHAFRFLANAVPVRPTVL
jgi:hypothetical protein